jgi:hypothetical protein
VKRRGKEEKGRLKTRWEEGNREEEMKKEKEKEEIGTESKGTWENRKMNEKK